MPRTIYKPSPRSSPPPDGSFAGDWRNRAACHDHPTLPASTWDDSLMADDDGRQERRQSRAGRIEQAKAVCRTCPVRQRCLDDVDLDFDEGVRGGEDIRDLWAARRQARSA